MRKGVSGWAGFSCPQGRLWPHRGTFLWRPLSTNVSDLFSAEHLSWDARLV